MNEESLIWIVCVTLTFICVIILIVVLCIHVYNVITISHLRKRETINKTAGVLTLLSAICSTGVIALQFMLWFAVLIEYCYPLQLTLALLWNPAKLSMQLVFVLNLHFVYKQTPYRYNPICLLFIGVSLIIIYGLLLLWTCITLQMAPLPLSNGVGMRCNAYSPVEVGLVVMSVDFVCSIGFVIAFVRPIKQMLREHTQTSPTDAIHKVLYTQTKVMVLVGTASVSTVILLLSIRLISIIGWHSLIAMIYVLVPTDQVINVMCLILLSQYYDNKKCFSYETLCCCCISCCKCACGMNQTHDTHSSDKHTTKKTKTRILTASSQIPTTNTTDSTYNRTETADDDATIGSARLEMTSTDLEQETTSLM